MQDYLNYRPIEYALRTLDLSTDFWTSIQTHAELHVYYIMLTY